jgi:ribulose-phosphate 3-epimerase
LENCWDKLDMVLLMSVNPGFGGQEFITPVLEKVVKLRSMIDERGLDIRLEVDGGIKLNNIADVAAAGADTFVSGSAIFNEDNYQDIIIRMREALLAVS